MNILNKLLSFIPGNGYKTIVGSTASIVLFVQSILTTADGAQLMEALSTRPLNWVAISVLVLGILHKYVKAKANE